MSDVNDRGRGERMCEQIHKALDHHLEKQDKRIDRHSERIDKLEQFQAGVTVEIRELCVQIKNLVAAVKWGTSITILTLLGFFVWYIQRL